MERTQLLSLTPKQSSLFDLKVQKTLQKEADFTAQKIFSARRSKLERPNSCISESTKTVMNEIQQLISSLGNQIQRTDFSNGYELKKRRHADLNQIVSIFKTYNTIFHKFHFAHKKNPVEMERFRPRFHYDIRKMSFKILEKVAKDNIASREKELSSLPENSKEGRAYVGEKIEALNSEKSPAGWKQASVVDFRKFLAINKQYPKNMQISKEQAILINTFAMSDKLLDFYSKQ